MNPMNPITIANSIYFSLVVLGGHVQKSLGFSTTLVDTLHIRPKTAGLLQLFVNTKPEPHSDTDRPSMPIFTDRFPVELWWRILRLSVRNPSLFETKWDHPPDDLIFGQGWETSLMSSHAMYSESLPTKLAICQVSRSWRDFGVELLYEHLCFTSEDVQGGMVIPKITANFERHADRAGYGRSTERVDVPIEALIDTYASPFLRLLESCHKIRIFALNPPRSAPPNIEGLPILIALLETRFNRSLRRFNLTDTSENPRFYHSESFLFPNVPLETWELFAWKFPADPPPATETVSTLILNFIPLVYELPAWRFPALRHLCVNQVSNCHIPALQHFMVVNAPRLISFHIKSDIMAIFDSLAELLIPATNLRCLVIDAVGGSFPWDSRFPSITHIGIRSTRAYIDELGKIALHYCFSSLRCIRYLDHTNPVENIEEPASMHARRKLLALITARNIRIEDHHGQLIDLNRLQFENRQKYSHIRGPTPEI